MICREQLYHGLAAFAGLSGRLRRTKDELISSHRRWWTERFLLHLVSNAVQPPPLVHSTLPIYLLVREGRWQEANEAWDNPQGFGGNPISAQRAQGRTKSRNPDACEGAGTFPPSRKHPRFYRGKRLSLCCPSLLSPAAQPQLGHGQTHSTPPAMAGGHGWTLCSAVLGQWWSVILSLTGRLHVGRNSPSPKLTHSPPCLLVIILTLRARNPLQTEHQSLRAITKANPQVPRERLLTSSNDPTWKRLWIFLFKVMPLVMKKAVYQRVTTCWSCHATLSDMKSPSFSLFAELAWLSMGRHLGQSPHFSWPMQPKTGNMALFCLARQSLLAGEQAERWERKAGMNFPSP